MSVQTLGRCGAALFLAMLLSGCSLMGFGDSDRPGGTYIYSGNGGGSISNECQSNRSSCMHEGRYELGERDYAEQAAKNLNKAALERLRRNAPR